MQIRVHVDEADPRRVAQEAVEQACAAADLQHIALKPRQDFVDMVRYREVLHVHGQLVEHRVALLEAHELGCVEGVTTAVAPEIPTVEVVDGAEQEEQAAKRYVQHGGAGAL
jgi:hypothetical protein